MKFVNLSLGASVSAIALGLALGGAQAGQSVIQFDICQGPSQSDYCGPTNNTSYIGPGFDSALAQQSSSVAGGVNEGGGGSVDDAYDGWGAIYGAQSYRGSNVGSVIGYGAAFNGLNAMRQTQSYVAVPELPANSIRWFDSFTNTTGSSITANIAFGGNLGSDSNTYIHATGPGFVVTGQGAPGQSSSDPVIAHLYGNNSYAFIQAEAHYANGDDNPYIVFPVTVAPGQTVSIMNVNILFGDTGRDTDPDGAIYAADVAQAIQQSELFINSPIFAGLTVDQIASLLNWGVQIDGSLPVAGSTAALSQRLHQAYDDMLNRDAVWGTGNGQIATGALQYAAADEMAGKSDGAAALARSIGDAGGKMALSGFDGSRSFLFGGYTTGSQEFSPGDLDFSGYVAGLGVEHAVTPALLLGLAAGYGHGNGDVKGIYSDLDNRQFTLSPYARWQAANGTVFDARLSASLERWDYSRAAGVATAEADIDGYSLGARIGASHAIETSWARVTPFASLTYLNTHLDGYSETGAGLGNLTVPSYSVDALQGLAGVGVSRDWELQNGGRLRGFASVALGGSFLGDETITTSYSTSATAFLSRVETGHGAFGQVEAGFAIDVTPSLSLTSSYGGSFGADRNQNTVSLGLSGRL
jgi:uncharacterized protein YhjY with autotransporter beta-barrel domain